MPVPGIADRISRGGRVLDRRARAGGGGRVARACVRVPPPSRRARAAPGRVGPDKLVRRAGLYYRDAGPGRGGRGAGVGCLACGGERRNG